MLNHNFNILAISNNFEEDYLLNQKIFQLYNLNLLEILQIKSDKIYQKFENDFKLINYNNSIRQIKTEEYFLPQVYISSGERKNRVMKYYSFNNSKKNMISYILTNIDNKNINETKDDMNANETLIKTEEKNQEFSKFFIEPAKLIIHNNINFEIFLCVKYN